MDIEDFDIKTIRPEPGDVLVVTVPKAPALGMAEAIDAVSAVDEIERLTGCEVIFLEEGQSLSCMKREELKCLLEAWGKEGKARAFTVGEDQAKRRFSVDVKRFRQGDEGGKSKSPVFTGSRGVCVKGGPSG